MFLRGLAPAIGMIGGGELGGGGVQTGETRIDLLGQKGNNIGFGEKGTVFGGKEGSLSTKSVTPTGGGVIKYGVGKSPEF